MEHTQLIILMLANFQIILSGVLEQRHIKSKVAIIVAGEVLRYGKPLPERIQLECQAVFAQRLRAQSTLR